MSTLPRFDDLWARWRWSPIPGCSGRFRLMGDDKHVPISALIGNGALAALHHIPQARDPVLVARLQDGGIISYLRPDGTCLHTLNSLAGFNRKLLQLGIALDHA